MNPLSDEEAKALEERIRQACSQADAVDPVRRLYEDGQRRLRERAERKAASQCPECNGTGSIWGGNTYPLPCPACAGTGRIEPPLVSENGDIFQVMPDGTRRWVAKISEAQRRRKE